jgi:hypothetical protein
MRFFAAFSMTAGALSMSFVSKKKEEKNVSALIFGFHFPRYEMLTWLAARCADCPPGCTRRYKSTSIWFLWLRVVRKTYDHRPSNEKRDGAAIKSGMTPLGC